MQQHRFSEKRIVVSASVALVIAMAGCSGGSSTSNALPAATHPAGTAPQSVTVQMTFGGGSAKTSAIADVAHGGSTTRRPQYVSPSSGGVLVQVYAHGTTSPLLASSATDVSPGSASCGGSSSPTRTCSVIVAAPLGSDDFVITTYDAKPTTAGENGAFSSSAHVLGVGKTTQTIADGANTLSVYISGSISNIGSTQSYASLPADGVAHAFAFVLNPQDFDNNPIAAGTNDPYQNPITATLTEAGGSGHASLWLNGTNVGMTATLTNSSDALVLHYDGSGAAGYGTTVTLAATGAPSQLVTISPLIAASGNPFFHALAINFPHAAAQNVVVTPSELNAPSNVTFSALSSNTAVATVNASGSTFTVNPVGYGTATLTLKDSLSTTVSVPITVVGPLGVAPATMAFTYPGQPLTATVTEPLYSGAFTATSSNTGVATVTISGSTATVTAVAAGTSTITIQDTLGNSTTIAAGVTTTGGVIQ